jgi:phosphoglycolate phosphatase
MTRLRAIIFDVDGTLVDSQADIIGAMGRAFASENLEAPTREDILGIVGLSLDIAIARLAPDQSKQVVDRMVQGYKDAYVEIRAHVGAAQSSPLYPGAMAALNRLREVPEYLLAVATGKSRRGLDHLINAHNLDGYFLSQQVADFHPSKPHPSMISQVLQDLGVEPRDVIMIGDTSYDMDMARAAGVGAIAVEWGYHHPSQLEADAFVEDFADLDAAIETVLRDRNV